MSANTNEAFAMFTTPHFITLLIIGLIIFLLKLLSKKKVALFREQKIERTFAISLLIIEWLYYLWMVMEGQWTIRHSLPLELCSISLYAAIILLWTNNRHLYPFVFFAGIGGAIQAIVTPDLELGFPHFRFFHFFYTHAGIMITAFYFTWFKGNRPTFKGIIQSMIALNVVAAIVYLLNIVVNGNYMFLRMKPVNGSLLDYLGPYPWYIVSLEIVAFSTFLLLWILFKKSKSPHV